MSLNIEKKIEFILEAYRTAQNMGSVINFVETSIM
jgi:hypothetical protein